MLVSSRNCLRTYDSGVAETASLERKVRRPERAAASSPFCKKESAKYVIYSLKTKTRAWPANRTSFTWPFSSISSES